MTMNIQPLRAALFTIHDPHEVFHALREVSGELDDVAFWTLFREAWDRAPSYWNHMEAIRMVLTSERLNSSARMAPWTKHEIEWMKRAARRDKPVKVYRGASDRNLTGFSWTTKKAVALEHARKCGYEKGSLVTARVPMHSIIFFSSEGSEVVAFPEHVTIEGTQEVPGLSGQALHSRQVQIMVEAKGPATVMGLSAVDFFMDAFAGAKMPKEQVIQHLKISLDLLDKLGFILRREFTRDVLMRLEDGVRSEE